MLNTEDMTLKKGRYTHKVSEILEINYIPVSEMEERYFAEGELYG